MARRWLLLCPIRKQHDGAPEEPNEAELDTIRNDPVRLAEIRRRLSNISWWMRLLCQRIATRANAEDGEQGKFWQSRFRAVRILDEASLLACAAYIDLNPIRAALAETLEGSDFTSVQRRIQAAKQGSSADADGLLSPLSLGKSSDPCGPCPSAFGTRCSDKGFLPMPLADYLQLLDWTAHEILGGRRGGPPAPVPPILRRLSLVPETWCTMVQKFGRLFFHVAGRPPTVDRYRSPTRGSRFYLRAVARQLLGTAS